MITEEWRPIPGYESRYEVSSLGRVRSWLTYRGKPGPRILKPVIKPNGGHLNYALTSADGALRFHTGHRLVLSAFVGPLPAGLETRHLDGDPTNNALSNLRYGTKSENCRDRVDHGSASIDNLRRANRRRADEARARAG